VLEERGRQACALVGGRGREGFEGALGVDGVPVDDRVGDEVQAVRLGGLALEGVQADRAVPIAGILLVTSEWSQRTGMITFALVPVRSRVLGAKLAASLFLALATLAVSVAIVAAGVLIAQPGIDGTWSEVAPLIGQSAVYLTGGMVTGVAFGMVLLASAPAIVALFALPITWTAVASLPVFADAAPWLDTPPRRRPDAPGGPEPHPVGARRHRARALDAASPPDRHLADHAAGGDLVKALRRSAVSRAARPRRTCARSCSRGQAALDGREPASPRRHQPVMSRRAT